MSIRTKLLAGRNINTDSDFSKYIETVSNPGVIEGLEVVSGKVKVGKAWVLAERTNGETIQVLVENINEVSIDTSGTGYVIISIPQNMIDDGSLINEDGTNVATIEVVENLPIKNYLELAQLDSGVITDKRNIIRKVSEIDGIEADIEDLDERVEALEKAGAIDHLEESEFVGERYDSLSQSMFVQKTPALEDSTLEDCHIGDTNANTEIHIQRIANGTESNKLKLKVKMYGSPTTNLKVEVRKGIQVNISSTEAYWYGDEENILATGSLSYDNFSSNWTEKEFTLDNSVNVEKGTLLDIVVYQENGGSKVVNASNYYILASDSTQWSEGFSFVSVNGTTRSRSKFMPYCISNSFSESLIVKSKDPLAYGSGAGLSLGSFSGSGITSGVKKTIVYDSSTFSGTLNIKITGHTGYNNQTFFVNKNGTRVYTGGGSSTYDYSYTGTFVEGDWYEIGVDINVSGCSYSGNMSIVSGNIAIPGSKNLPTNAGLPKEVVDIGEVGYIKIFGDIDNNFYLGEELNSATVGNITLGKAVGYIKIGKYKIPYYL